MVRSSSLTLALGLLSSLSLAGCGSDRATEEAGEDRLLDAPVDETSTFSVGLCLGRPSMGGSLGAAGTCGRLTSVCSATLIAPNLVLTARHCINFPHVRSPLTLCTTPDNTFEGASILPTLHLHVTTSPSVREGRPKWYTVKKYRFPETSNPCNDDIALVVLDRNIPAEEATPIPVDVETDLAASPPKAMAIVGRGALLEEYDLQGGGFSLYDNGNYTRRVKTNIPVTCVPRDFGECDVVDHTIRPAPHAFTMSPGQIRIGPGALGGDSGSGFLDHASFEAGAPRVSAVMSYSGVDPDGKPNSSVGIRLSPHRALLVRVAREAAAEGGYDVPAWAAIGE